VVLTGSAGATAGPAAYPAQARACGMRAREVQPGGREQIENISSYAQERATPWVLPRQTAARLSDPPSRRSCRGPLAVHLAGMHG